MISENIRRLVKTVVHFAGRCHIYVGRRPDHVARPSLIFFPVLDGYLCCGFAGLMTCGLKSQPPQTRADLTLVALWKKLKSANVKNPSRLPDVTETVNAMADTVAQLKKEEAQEFLFFHPDYSSDLSVFAADLNRFIAEKENRLDEQTAFLTSAELESVNSLIVMLKDIGWALEKDILANLPKILALTGAGNRADIRPAAFRKYRKLNLALNALDRLEVRGRDSAGIDLTFAPESENDLKAALQRITEQGWLADYEKRTQPGDLLNLSVSVTKNTRGTNAGIVVTFTYKTFSTVGKLGRNVAELRNSIRNDRILRCFADLETSCENVLMHTRWASVGSITEENCHPVNNHSMIRFACPSTGYPESDVQIHVVLNGDVDNYTPLRQFLETQGEMIARPITTDTKIIPLQIEKFLHSGHTLTEAFRRAVNDLAGSHAIAMTSHLEPGKMFLALRGSGQSLYIGVSDDQYMFSSELYGLVEVMPRFLKMDGEAGGQICILDQNGPAGVRGITSYSYDGKILALTENMLGTAEITTRDIDRGDYPHFFLKEISESSLSVKRTLRGKYRMTATEAALQQVRFNLGEDIVPADIIAGLKKGRIKNIVIIGHGTAAVAGQAVADAFSLYLGSSPLHITARVASELSGFGLKDDLSDTLVIPITQSGTTTDTNRAVAMAKERGAHVISIVNRRQSDITAKSHGVFYTSDGRDIEMSVASSKAFYAQIVAGQVLALFFAQSLRTCTDEDIIACLRNLESAPLLMNQIASDCASVASTVKDAIGKKYWAVTGSGPNKAAADEIRIKLSELCYKTISTDIVENKKHIDLSAEPLILVCTAGSPESVTADIVKDVAIFKAHKANVIVIADEGEKRFQGVADAVIAVPVAFPPLPVILNAMAGHLWGYYAACAIDEEAQIFRAFRARLHDILMLKAREQLSVFDLTADVSVKGIINTFYQSFNTRRQQGAFSSLEGKTLSDLMLLLKYAAGKLPLKDMALDFVNDQGIFSPFELLDTTLGTVIDELSRPIDAIRHQAKTVTVGTSRKERPPEGIVFDLLKTLTFDIATLTYRDIMMIRRIQPVIASIPGYTIYDISALDQQGNPTDDSLIAVRVKGGLAAGMKSRADKPAVLMGVKRTIVSTGHAYLGRGKTDNAPILIIPLRTQEAGVGNLLLLHVRFDEKLTLQEKIDALGYRYNDIRNLIDEYNLKWDDRFIDRFSLEALFSEPIEIIAGRIKSQLNP
ncbi:MAG TPA: SIS domain-containing protein [Smithella sp.]|jgi:glucosamine--fructose-6-phosphate aminotransferase (isomerizing)|nr:SIS domain-containing protein [Smithella sp.]HOO35303.1 SIS domain-containing protein [Smithella sp.]HPR15873.1 SIS domain-containing protein [Smithella sp.]HPV50468.1 SIS domain-containing protein [Smithella sp.]